MDSHVKKIITIGPSLAVSIKGNREDHGAFIFGGGVESVKEFFASAPSTNSL